MKRTPGDDDEDTTVDEMEAGDEIETDDDADEVASTRGDGAERKRYRNVVTSDTATKHRETGDVIAADMTTEHGGAKRERGAGRCQSASNKQKLKAAEARFEYYEADLDDDVKEPTFNGGFPLLKQVRGKTFHPDETRRAACGQAAVFIDDVIKMADEDGVGVAVHQSGKEAGPDHDMPRDENGRELYGPGQTLDRKARTYDSKDGEDHAKRNDGPVRGSSKTTGKSGKIGSSGGYEPIRDTLFAERRWGARCVLNDVKAEAGKRVSSYAPLFFTNRLTFKRVGIVAGYNGKQATAVGSFIAEAWLDAVLNVQARNALVEADDASYQTYYSIVAKIPDGTGISARRYTLLVRENARLAARAA